MNSFKVYTVKSWLFDAKEKLLESQRKNNLNTINVRLDAEILLLHSLNKPRTFIYTDSDYILSKQELVHLENLLSRRLQSEPVAYIIGYKEFWSLELKVTPDVLIPRPETELLVEQVLDKLPKDQSVNIADIGTGSGAIAISLAKERPNWTIHAVDLSIKALNIAKENAVKNKIKNIPIEISKLKNLKIIDLSENEGLEKKFNKKFISFFELLSNFCDEFKNEEFINQEKIGEGIEGFVVKTVKENTKEEFALKFIEIKNKNHELAQFQDVRIFYFQLSLFLVSFNIESIRASKYY